MIPLTLRAHTTIGVGDFVCRAALNPNGQHDALLEDAPDGPVLSGANWRVRLEGVHARDLVDDVLLVRPDRGIARRLIRASSRHNTLLITEQCDQLCVMCSQPPKKSHDDLFAHYQVACQLAPEGAVIGLSGGEPTLYKSQLFDLVEAVHATRPDLKFHVLSNGQHFAVDDVGFLSSPAGQRIMWGVPLYASDAQLHDRLVGKEGAFEMLLGGLAVLAQGGAKVELRTVIMRENIDALVDLARFICRHVPFANPWAIMQLENIGYARNRWNDLFYDHSGDFSLIGEAIDIARLAGIETTLYNFPLCTVPAPYRRFAPSTISDWKRKYEPACEDCLAKNWCSGFFEWHPSDRSYGRLGLQ